LGGALLMSAVLIKIEVFGGGSSDAATRSPAPQQAAAASRTSAAEAPAPAATPTRTATAVPTRTTPLKPPKAPKPSNPPYSPPPVPATPPTCAESDLALRVAPGAATYRLGELPVVRYSMTNHSARTCRRDLGPALQEALVYDHSTRLWSSNDCWPGVEHRVVVLRPGRPETFSMRWSRTSSLPECAGIRRVVPAGTYTLVGRVGNLVARAPITLS
jgi:hypothetical protein